MLEGRGRRVEGRESRTRSWLRCRLRRGKGGGAGEATDAHGASRSRDFGERDKAKASQHAVGGGVRDVGHAGQFGDLQRLEGVRHERRAADRHRMRRVVRGGLACRGTLGHPESHALWRKGEEVLDDLRGFGLQNLPVGSVGSMPGTGTG